MVKVIYHEAILNINMIPVLLHSSARLGSAANSTGLSINHLIFHSQKTYWFCYLFLNSYQGQLIFQSLLLFSTDYEKLYQNYRILESFKMAGMIKFTRLQDIIFANWYFCQGKRVISNLPIFTDHLLRNPELKWNTAHSVIDFCFRFCQSKLIICLLRQFRRL